MTNVDYLDHLSRNLLQDINPKRAAAIGAADGDISFSLSREGWEMTIVDNPPTNWNSLRGAKLYKEATGSSVEIVGLDLDSVLTGSCSSTCRLRICLARQSATTTARTTGSSLKPVCGAFWIDPAGRSPTSWL